jgi:DNA topoisomerase-3
LPDHLFIAEKPSLAEVIAKARAEQLGVSASKGNGSWTVGPDSVTWLFGHMYELANPDEYDEGLKRWQMSTLPIIPDKWKRKAHKDKQPHLAMIKGLMSKTNTVVNVGDAEREGQLLVDELLEEMGWNPFSEKTKRVWVSSFAQKDLLAALDGMFPNKDKENLSKAATMRQRADWLHGINMTRLYTILARTSGADMLVSVGRVQSPTLKIVVDRDREIEAFKPTDHYLPNGMFKHANGSFRADWVIPDDYEGLDPSGRLVDKSVADKIAVKIVGKTGKIQSFASNNKSRQPPLPYSLSALQTDCSQKLGLTAAQTLEVAQALYEKHKATTYPRSDSRYLPKSILTDEAPGIMTALASTPGLDSIAQKADLRLKSPAWNDSKVSDHHGIIPTGEFDASKLANMSPMERKVFELIAKAFISQFYADFTWKSLVATLTVEGETFKGTGRQITNQGWKVVYGAEEEEDEEEEDKQVIPTMSKGDGVTVEKSDISAKRTKPPAHFTDGTLIAAMTNIHRFVQDPEVKRRLKESDGIGTEATRANIIETLLHPSRKFLERKGKTKIVSSKAGQSIIDVLPKELTDPGMTAIWEAQLTKISQGEASDDQFSDILVKTLHRLVQRGKEGGGVKVAGSIEPLAGHGETCPSCGRGQMITRKLTKGDNKGQRFLACNAWSKDDPNSCRHAIWPDDAKKANVKPMPGDGEACPKCGQGRMITRMSRNNKRFMSCSAWKKDDPKSCNHVVWDDAGETDKMPGDGQTCTKCNKGIMRTRKTKAGKRFLSCDAWNRDDPNSCNNVTWDNSEPSSSSGKKPFRIGSKGATAAPAGRGAASPSASPRRTRLGRS